MTDKVKMFKQEMSQFEGTEKQLKEFYRLVGGILIALGILFCWKQRTSYPVFLALGALLIVTGLIRYQVLRPLYKGWMLLALCLGFVVSRTLLTVLYYLVLSPISILARCTGKKFLNTAFREGVPSYWIRRQGDWPDRKNLERQF